MAVYSFRIKKGKYLLELSTSDKELLVEQFDRWVNAAKVYARRKKVEECKNMVNEQIAAEEKITKENIEAHIANHKSEDSLRIEDTIFNDIKEEKTEEKNNLDIFYKPQVEENSVSISQKVASTGVFDSILENSLNNPKTELSFKSAPTIKKDNAFLNYMASRKIERKIDYLLLTAYYFTQYEQKPRFTLKQLNAKLMQNIAVIIDHSVLQEAINRDYIECLPDLTGLVGASEYRLTAYGEKVLLDD
ncbi:hypothetical protein IJ384_04030 [bacterium]|nr:hypothetical protein [bacterium]